MQTARFLLRALISMAMYTNGAVGSPFDLSLQYLNRTQNNAIVLRSLPTISDVLHADAVIGLAHRATFCILEMVIQI